MRGLLNILFALVMCMCVHACKTRMHSYERVGEVKFDSIGSVAKVFTSANLDMCYASRIMDNTESGSWQKILIYDTSKPGNPLLMDIERKDSLNSSSEKVICDSLSMNIESSMHDSLKHVVGSAIDIENDKETISEERTSNILSNIVKIWVLVLLLSGLYVLSKKIR